MARKLLSVRDLKTSFFTHVGEVKAVRGISFDVSAVDNALAAKIY